MARPDDPAFADWVAEARAQRIEAAADLRGARLRRVGGELIGPCPACGGTDRFGINLRRQIFHCRGSGKGGDVIAMVEYLEACDFIAACTALAGRPPPSGDSGRVDHAERQRREEARAAAAAESERYEIDWRERERRKAYDIWRAGVTAVATPAAAYLDARGLMIPLAPPLRYLAEAAYWHEVGGKSQVIHSGPAMLAAITDETGRFAGVHITWISLDRFGVKATILHPETGEALPAKKVRGSKRRGSIKLCDPVLDPPPTPPFQGGETPRQCHSPPPERGRLGGGQATRLVIGEGIETVLSVFTAELGSEAGWRTAYWAAIDLGHLGGKAKETVAHPTMIRADKRGRKRLARVPGPEPELHPDRDLMLPERFTEVVILGDGDSDRFLTEMAIRRAAARWATPGRAIRVAWAPDGRDFNDLRRE